MHDDTLYRLCAIEDGIVTVSRDAKQMPDIHEDEVDDEDGEVLEITARVKKRGREEVRSPVPLIHEGSPSFPLGNDETEGEASFKIRKNEVTDKILNMGIG